MMHESVLIELHVITKGKATLLDIDCIVDFGTPLHELIEIVFTNYNLELDRINAIYAFIPLQDDPQKLGNSDCKKTMRDLDITNGVTFRVVYSEGSE